MSKAWVLILLAVASGAPQLRAQQPAPQPQFITPQPVTPLFFREEWRQTGAVDASTNFRPATGITPAAVTNPALELKLYDPGVKHIPDYIKSTPTGSFASDWKGPSCVQLSGYNQ